MLLYNRREKEPLCKIRMKCVPLSTESKRNTDKKYLGYVTRIATDTIRRKIRDSRNVQFTYTMRFEDASGS